MSLLHPPISFIVSVFTWDMRRYMTPLVHIDRALMSSGVKPTWVPVMLTAAWRSSMISELLTVDHHLPLYTTDMSV